MEFNQYQSKAEENKLLLRPNGGPEEAPGQKKNIFLKQSPRFFVLWENNYWLLWFDYLFVYIYCARLSIRMNEWLYVHCGAHVRWLRRVIVLLPCLVAFSLSANFDGVLTGGGVTSHGSFQRDKGSTPWWKVFQNFMTASLTLWSRSQQYKTCGDYFYHETTRWSIFAFYLNTMCTYILGVIRI